MTISIDGCIDPQCDCHHVHIGSGVIISDKELSREQITRLRNVWAGEDSARGRVRDAISGLSVMAKMRVLHDVNLEVIQGFDD